MEDPGVILAPTCPHLAPFGEDFARSEPGQNLPKSAKTAFERFFMPRSPPRPPRPPPDLDFSRFWGYFSTCFDNVSKDSFINSASNFNVVLKDFSFNLFCSTLLERSRGEGGGGTRPQGVFDKKYENGI